MPINMSRIDERNKQCGTNWQEGYVLWQCDAEHCMKLCQFQLFNTTAQLSSSRPQLEFSAEGLTRGNNLQLHYHSLKTHFTADVIINLEGRIRVEQNNY